MRLRAVHFACFMLLLSALGSAEARAQRVGELDLPTQYVSLLMQQGSVAASSEQAFPCGTPEALKLGLPANSVAHVRAVWTMRPPSAHCVRLQDFTSDRA